MFHLPQAFRHGVRTLAHARGLAIVAILSLGVAVNVAVFAVVYSVLVRPLPHPDADRLVAIWSRSLTDGREHQMAPLDFFDFERQSTSFDRVAAYYPPGFTLTGGSAAERVPGARATSRIFDVFGVTPMLGRRFLPEEDKPDQRPGGVITQDVDVEALRRRTWRDGSTMARTELEALADDRAAGLEDRPIDTFIAAAAPPRP